MTRVIPIKINAKVLLKLFDSIIENKDVKTATYSLNGYHIRVAPDDRMKDYNVYMRRYHNNHKEELNKAKRLKRRQWLNQGRCGKCGKINTTIFTKCLECQGKLMKQ